MRHRSRHYLTHKASSCSYYAIFLRYIKEEKGQHVTERDIRIERERNIEGFMQVRNRFEAPRTSAGQDGCLSLTPPSLQVAHRQP
jgi:hypothetical protein